MISAFHGINEIMSRQALPLPEIFRGLEAFLSATCTALEAFKARVALQAVDESFRSA